MIRAILFGVLLPWLIQVAGEKWVEGDGAQATQTRELKKFDEIELRIQADMRVTIGKPTPLTIETDENILPLIKMNVRNGRLVISSDCPFRTKNGPDINVTVAKLHAVEVVGAGDMWISNLDNENLSVGATGTADVHLSGKTKHLSVAATGTSDVHAYDLEVDTANATLIGSADAKLNVSKSLTATITGNGDLHYKGDPMLTKAIIGEGDVTRVGPKNGA